MKSMNTNTAAESVDTNAPATPDVPAEATSPSAAPAEAPAETDSADATADAAPAADADSTDAAAASAPAAAPAAAPAPATAQPTSARALLKQLQQEFVAFRDCLPLAIGIDKQLLARMPGLDRKIMRAALGIHTGSMRYLRAMEKAKVRHDLDGAAGAEVTDTHRLHAKEQLQQRFKKEADRKKAERDALATAAAEEEANRQRQEKLKALASKFSKN